MGLAVLSIIQGEHFECADGARLHHLGGCDPVHLLKHHDALAQLMAEHAVNRVPAPSSTDIGAAAVGVGERECENGKCMEVSSDRVL